MHGGKRVRRLAGLKGRQAALPQAARIRKQDIVPTVLSKWVCGRIFCHCRVTVSKRTNRRAAELPSRPPKRRPPSLRFSVGELRRRHLRVVCRRDQRSGVVYADDRAFASTSNGSLQLLTGPDSVFSRSRGRSRDSSLSSPGGEGSGQGPLPRLRSPRTCRQIHVGQRGQASADNIWISAPDSGPSRPCI